jgi:hypothetical protein
MKQLFIISAFIIFLPCFVPGELAAQTAKGDQLFGIMGKIGYPYSPLAFYKSGRYDVFYQRFLTPRFSFGGSVNFRYAYGFHDTHWNSVGLGIEGRYYLLKKPSAFQPYVFAGLETNWHRTVYPTITTRPIWLGLQANVGVGFDYYVRPNFALNARGGISFDNIQSGRFSPNWSFQVGATYRIPHKEKKKKLPE